MIPRRRSPGYLSCPGSEAGNGLVQSKREYADFILQAEIPGGGQFLFRNVRIKELPSDRD